MCLHPFRDEVDGSLRLDRGSGDIVDVKPVELERPFRDASGHILITDDFTKGCHGHN